MVSLLGFDVPHELFQHWSLLLVNDYAPYFLNTSLAKQLESELFILERAEYKQFGLSQSHTDSYAPYRVNAEGEFISLLSAKELMSLDAASRDAILTQQIDLGRGQVYQWKDIEAFLVNSPEAEAWRVREHFILDASIWTVLPDNVRQEWLIQFISREQMDCISPTLSQADWEKLWAVNPSLLKNLLGWELQSGANCFATSLALATKKYEISHLWLHQPAFFRGLVDAGYSREENIDPNDPELKNLVIIWEDADGQAQHSAYLLAEQIVVNKNSQCWYAPRQLVYLSDLIAHWHEDEFKLIVYTKNQAPKTKH